MAVPVIGLFLFGATCTLVSDVDEADALRYSLGASLVSVDLAVTEAEAFNTDFLNNQPAFDLMQNNLTQTAELDDGLVSAQATLEQAQSVTGRMAALHMPDWYHESYAQAVSDQIDTRVEQVTHYQSILSKEENFALAVVSFYSGLYKFYEAIDAVENLPPITTENTDAIRKQVRSIQDEMSLATSDFNSAATYVNVPLFTRMRDSSVDYQQALDTLRQMVKLLDAMQSETDAEVIQQQSDEMDQLSYTLDALLVQFSDNIPEEYLDDADGFTSLTIDDFVDWRAANLDPLVDSAWALSAEIQQIDAAADTIYSQER